MYICILFVTNSHLMCVRTQAIPEQVWRADFGSRLVESLDAASARTDGVDYSRFGWLLPFDLEVLNAMALPLGDVRDPVEIPNPGGPVIVHMKEVCHVTNLVWICGW
jgi:hypothetical protein